MSRVIRVFAALAMLAMTGACATIIQGTSQDIRVVTEPSGAACVMTREGAVIARVISTPGQVSIDRSHSSITMQCTRSGYEPATVRMSSTVSVATFGNILIGGLIGVVVDASTGASTAYDSEIRVALTPVGALPFGSGPAPTPAGPAPAGPVAPGPEPPSGARPFVEPLAPPPGPAIRR